MKMKVILRHLVLMTALGGIGLLLPVTVLAQPATFEAGKLPNGIQILYQLEPEIRFTSVVFFFKGGQSLEKIDRAGLNYLTTRLMAEITDEDRLNQLISAGVNLTAGGRSDFSFIHLECQSQDLEKVLSLVIAGLKNPLFSGVRIDAVKKTLRLESEKEAHRLLDSALICLRQRLFPDSPYRFSLYGTEASLKSISKKEIAELYSQLVDPSRFLVLIVSDLQKETVFSLLTRYLSWVKKTESASGSASQLVNDQSQKKNLQSESDCQPYRGPAGAAVVLGFKVPGQLSEILPAAFVLEKIVGEGPGSLLWRLRQDKALAYNLNSRLEIIGRQAVIVLFLETEANKAEEALLAMKEKFSELGKTGFEKEEIKWGKMLARNSYRRQSFSRDNRLAFLSFLLANDLTSDYYNTFLDKIEAISEENLNRLVRIVFHPGQAHEVLLIKN